MSESKALVRTWRKLRVVCSRCGAEYSDDHICADHVRHPATDVFLRGMQMAMEVDWLERGESKVMAAASLALMFANLPDSEKGVANVILEHAGVEAV